MEKRKILIVYWSRTGNTKAMAQLIQNKVGGDLVQIETEEKRPTNYQAEVAQNQQEQIDGSLPALKTKINNFASYEKVFIGTPTWNMALPQAVVTFLTDSDFTGKTVLPFNTNAGYGAGSTFRQIATHAVGAQVLNGLAIKGGAETDGIFLAIKDKRENEVAQQIDNWLQNLDI